MIYNNNSNQYEGKEEFPGRDFNIHMNMHTLPFTELPSYLPEGVFGICTEGNAELQIYSRKYVICRNDIIIFPPGFLAALIKSSFNFTVTFCTFSNALFHEVLNGSIKCFQESFHTYTRNHCIY